MNLQEAANIATIAASILAVPPIVWVVISHILTLRRERARLTLEFWEKINQEIKNQKREIKKEFGKKLTKEQAEQILADENDRIQVNKILNLYERLSTGVNLGIYDLKTINRITGTNLIGNYERFREYIVLRRIKMHRPKAWKEFEKLTTNLTKHRIKQLTGIFNRRS